VSALDFLSPARCAAGTLVSPLARALGAVAETALAAGRRPPRDLSLEGKVELRGDLDRLATREGEELVRLTPRRGLLLTGDPLAAVERAREAGVLAYDATGLLAGLELQGEQVVRRLTDLDLDRLPAAGPFARVTAVVLRDGDTFRVYVPQELGHDVALAVLDALEGVGA
jgi:hypothetical protein